MTTSRPSFTLVDAADYYTALTKEVPKAKKRIVLAAMRILSGPKTDVVLTELSKAAKRGVRVSVLIDNYTRLAPLKLNASRASVQRVYQLLEEVEKNGGTVHYFGSIGLNPFKGRCHIKATVVDDVTYTFGGVNFEDALFKKADYMLRSESPEVATCVEQLIERIGNITPPITNGEVTLAPNTHVLFDGGQPGNSIIYERACELAAQAKKIYYVSQMAPSGQLGSLLMEGNSTCYFNRPEQMELPDAWGQAFDQQKLRLPNKYTKDTYIHAKFILFELPSGRKAALTGSNNFSYRGVAYGTQEIALHTTDTAVWDQLYSFLQHTIR